MSYSAILERLDQTSIDMELKRTQFHDTKGALEDAEENLAKLDKENINYEKLNFYDNLEKAKDSFKEENYEKSKEMALQSAEDSLSTLVEIDIVKSDRNELGKLFDNAIIEKLQFDKKEKNDIKNSIKNIEKSIETGKISDARQKIDEQMEKLEKKITIKRIRKFAPPSWNELENIDKNAEIYEYYINDKWDLDGIKDDLKILNKRKSKETADNGIKLDEVPLEWKELEKVDKDADVNDYRIKDRWDLDGIKADLEIVKRKKKNLQNEKEKRKWRKEKGAKIRERQKEKDTTPRKFTKKKHRSTPHTNEVKGTKLEDLKDLKELYDEGLLDIDEFKQMKKEILGK